MDIQSIGEGNFNDFLEFFHQRLFYINQNYLWENVIKNSIETRLVDKYEFDCMNTDSTTINLYYIMALSLLILSSSILSNFAFNKKKKKKKQFTVS